MWTTLHKINFKFPDHFPSYLEELKLNQYKHFWNHLQNAKLFSDNLQDMI